MSFNFMAAVTICSDFGAPKNSLALFPLVIVKLQDKNDNEKKSKVIKKFIKFILLKICRNWTKFQKYIRLLEIDPRQTILMKHLFMKNL